ncbi:MAG: DEAD/DEAH box helicase [Candidatus Eisenbacteria bacterium]|uniref:DEAD/DEAH box helicase n=1 Tax=Eiseniibacteriota bacterium TaxID=2212470 RepID=A0A948RXY1_UNCEI|nr:DEAD/DEAH box helicase [Candidatus Eisenbacteria bacterium]MBU1949028.1 DEAD/DEAH box helicase [Candidatus Eisenbacteria bacterium]MBU2692511.1 DEAD/DEAH box helicase [Candidatus Eisenbacteria bacterium]
MSQISLDNNPDVGCTLICGLTPSGLIDVGPGLPDDGPLLATAVQQRILQAFNSSRGKGVLQLGAGELGTDLHPSLSYWRDIGQLFVAGICKALDPTDPESLVIPDPDTETLSAFVQAAPPMRGAELITLEMLEDLWADIGKALAAEALRFKDGIQGYLKKQNSLWNVVGRVCFHLAENKRDPEYPFAFIATYIYKVSKQAKPQHQPLGRALTDYAGAKNRRKLLALLSPLSRAAEQSAFVHELVDSGDIYHPLSWTPKEAHRFLCEIPLYEQAGLVVRMPDWWSAKNRPRPRISVSVGGHPPSKLGMDALLDFNIKLTIEGDALSRKEVEELLASTEGLILIKGRWVEVDGDKLSKILDQWRAVQKQVRLDGVSFGEAMRLLAGAQLGGGGIDDAEDARPEWSEVIAGKWLSSKLDALRSPELQSEIEANAGLNGELRPYQKVGVQWLWTLHGLELGGCLADDMGLGKTIQVLAILSLNQQKKRKGTDLLVVPASLIDNWRLEIERFAPALRTLIAHPSHISSADLKRLSRESVAAHDAVITTYGTAMRTEWMIEYPWRIVVLDEAQAIKNPSAKQTKAVKALKSRWRLALTGTPVENRLGDLWSIFDFLNPGLLGSAKAFNSFCKSVASGKQSYAPLRKLVQPYILRRLKSDKNIITDLPDKTEINAYCLLSKRQAALYQQSVDEMRQAIEYLDGIERRGVVLAFLMRFKQICNHPSHWLGDGNYEATDSGKFTRLREICGSIAARQDKVLVFTQFREMTEPLAGFLSEVFGQVGLVLHGGTPVKKRHKLVQSFQNDDRIPFMVLSLKAGGTGLNLTAASHVIHFDRWWNPAVENQATDRAFRIGQKKNVLVHKFVCRGTVEERIDELIAGKQNLSDEILSAGTESALTELSNKELISIVSLDLCSAVES